MAVCVECQVKLQEKKTTIERKLNDQMYVINDVPVTICPKCGESYVDSAVLRKIEKLVQENPSITRINYRG